MARPLRIEYEGASYHVMNRGNARRRVFHGDDGYALFVDKLGRAGETFRVLLRAFCLMASHFHLCLATPEADLAARLGGITVGSLSRCRQLMEQRLARHRALRGTVARREQTPCAGRESHDA